MEEDIKVGELSEDDPEIKKAQVHTMMTKEEKGLSDQLHKFSDWTRATRAIARLIRLAKEVKGHKSRVDEATTLKERQDAEQLIIHSVQENAFSQAIKFHKERSSKRPSHLNYLS